MAEIWHTVAHGHWEDTCKILGNWLKWFRHSGTKYLWVSKILSFFSNFRPNLHVADCKLLFFSFLWIADEHSYSQANFGGNNRGFQQIIAI